MLLGGDTGTADHTTLTVAAIGRSEEPLTSRLGASADDVLCLTGRTGAGPAVAARYLLGDDATAYPETWLRPRARLAEGLALRGVASACTDVSDGLVNAAALLASLNGLGAELEWSPATLDERGAAYFAGKGLPLWLIWVAEVADYELLLTIPHHRLTTARAAVPSLNPVGRLSAEPGLSVWVDGRSVPLTPEDIPSFDRADVGGYGELLAKVVLACGEKGLP